MADGSQHQFVFQKIYDHSSLFAGISPYTRSKHTGSHNMADRYVNEIICSPFMATRQANIFQFDPLCAPVLVQAPSEAPLEKKSMSFFVDFLRRLLLRLRELWETA
ncbi:hypothetical protein RND71_015429 [Anisodus tanguticus]|uniref:Uncharacterized protein n=1 Tax=Anisodus tanguticus TaxID=243964 RepID=A0AAE1S7Y7_9SOLA|nr:hypothetical protein RND71_015429 [Anisodus tanguticus]